MTWYFIWSLPVASPKSLTTFQLIICLTFKFQDLLCPSWQDTMPSRSGVRIKRWFPSWERWYYTKGGTSWEPSLPGNKPRYYSEYYGWEVIWIGSFPSLANAPFTLVLLFQNKINLFCFLLPWVYAKVPNIVEVVDTWIFKTDNEIFKTNFRVVASVRGGPSWSQNGKKS